MTKILKSVRHIFVRFSVNTEEEMIKLLEENCEFMTLSWYNHEGFNLFIEILECGWVEAFHVMVENFVLNHSEKEFMHYCSFINCNHGRTLLHFAVRNPEIEIIKTLINYMSIDAINKTDWEGKTSLHVLAKKVSAHAVECAKVLTDNGADIAITSRHLQTPLYFAIKEGSFNMVRFLAFQEKTNYDSNYLDKLKSVLVIRCNSDSTFKEKVDEWNRNKINYET